VQKNILQMNNLFLLSFSTPLLFGFDGYYSRLDGLMLVVVGILFYFYILKKARKEVSQVNYTFSPKNLVLLVLCMSVLLLSAHFTVEYGVALAHDLHVHPIFIGMFLVGLGTTLPEMFFAIKAVSKNRDGLALGDILGTVMADATIVVGIMALITPFAFKPQIAYVTALFMLVAAFFLFNFMRSDKVLTKKEGLFLLFFYLTYVAVEFLLNTGGNG